MINICIGGLSEKHISLVHGICNFLNTPYSLVTLKKGHLKLIVGDIAFRSVTVLDNSRLDSEFILFDSAEDSYLKEFISIYRDVSKDAFPLFAVLTKDSVTWSLESLLNHLEEERRSLN